MSKNTSKIKTDPLVKAYLNTIDKESTRLTSISTINRYVKWRKLTPEEIIKSGLEELDQFTLFLNDESLSISTRSKVVIISKMKQFLIFHNVPIKRYQKQKQELYYKDDPAMQDFMILTGTKEETKRAANRYLASYCDFRNKNPTELLKEVKILEKTRLRVLLKQFYDSLTIKSKVYYVQKVIRFYKLLADVHIDMELKHPRKRLLMGKKILVDKEIVQKMLNVADLRDSMIIMSIFESGLNPVDLCSFNYGDLKHFLNLENPMSIDKVIVIPRIRSKTDYEFLACFGIQSLQFISKWLAYVKKELSKLNKSLEDDFPVFTQKSQPFQRMSMQSLAYVFKTISDRAGLPKILSSDFRNSFNTRTKTILKHYDKELFMGHSGGIERHYDVSSIDYYIEEYSKAWKILFNLDFDDVKMGQLEEKVTDQDLQIQKLEKKLGIQGEVINHFYRILGNEIEDKGLDDVLKQFFPLEK